jgi:SPP1 gp7 family putative phage head morphogenesis protein
MNFDLFDPKVLSFLNSQGLKLCTTISEGLREFCKEAIAEGLTNGESIVQIRNRIMDSIEGYSKVDAERLARTETNRACNEATLEGYKQGGVVDGKQWLAAGNSCEDCLALDGEIVGLDEDFSAGVSTPPLHPNCVCTLLGAFNED